MINIPAHCKQDDVEFVNQHYFTSNVWQLKSSHSSTSLYIHEDVLERASPALQAMCNRSWKETNEHIYRFEEDVPEEVIACFVNFAYRENYAPAMFRQALGTGPGLKDTRPSNDGKSMHPLLLHAHVYIFADMYIMEKLGVSAQRKIKFSLLALELDNKDDREVVFDCFELIFENIPPGHPLLPFLAEYAKFNLNKFPLSMDRFNTLMRSSKFEKHYKPIISRPRKNPFICSDREIMEDNPLYSQPLPGVRRPRFGHFDGDFRGFKASWEP